MKAHESNAFAVAEFLENHPRVTKVLYPGLASHPHHDLARKQMDNFSGMLSFQIENGANCAQQMMSTLEVIHYAVSLGHHRSLICWMDTNELMASTYALSGEQLSAYRDFAGDGVYRLSVGLEDPEDLCEDLAKVLG
jgi:methionine-gamma-lyase